MPLYFCNALGGFSYIFSNSSHSPQTYTNKVILLGGNQTNNCLICIIGLPLCDWLFVLQVMRWTTEWTLPRRLLRKRLLPSLRQCDKYYEGPAADYPDGRYEWLVKWRGLSYEHATWELENAPFLISPEGQGLIKDYENRRKKAKLTSGGDKVRQRQDY